MSAMKLSGLALICGCFILSGCGNKSADTANATTTGTTGTTGGEAPKPKDEPLKITDTVKGTGEEEVASGDDVWVLYKGTLKNGTVIDTNMAPDKDVYEFKVGQGAVIKGWDQGLPGMRVGGTRHLHIPSSLAYGPNANGKVPANADLDFDIKLLGLVKVGQENVIDTKDLKVGSGAVAKDGDTVTLQYVGKLLNDKVFDDSSKFKKPYSFTIGKNEALPCIDKGVQGMKVGGIRRIVAPPATAFVLKPQGIVPANSEVVFTVTLVGVK